MRIDCFYYKIYKVDSRQSPVLFLGTAFPVAPNGGLITCRHVVDTPPEAERTGICVYDNEAQAFVQIEDILLPSDGALDLAFLPNALRREKAELLPLLEPSEIMIGEHVYSFGYYAIGRHPQDVARGFFSGTIVNIGPRDEVRGRAVLTLPYAVLEGMSGSPVMTYHHGPKVLGACCGNHAVRVAVHEVTDYEDTEREYRETVSRIVELGLAHHGSTVASFLKEVGVSGFIVSSAPVDIPGLV